MSAIQTTCPDDGNVMLKDRQVLIDVDADAYRFICPGPCEGVVQKTMDDRIFYLLRMAGVRTIDEVVLAESVVLNDDRNIWAALLSS